MFKSIEYKLIFFVGLLILAVVAATYLFTQQLYAYTILSVIIILFSIRSLYKQYRKFNQNILFLLNALDNGDYSFRFAETKMSKREKELNQMMNRIKDILTKARKEVIENEKFLSLIVESVSTGIIILDENNNVQTTNKATNQLLGLPVFTHLNQLKAIDETFPQLFKNIQTGEKAQLKIINEREEKQISLQVSKIILKKGVMKVITLSNIGSELEMKEMESWMRLIRVMTHEIMNSIAPITSLSETLLFSHKKESHEVDEVSLKENTIEALETISSTAKGLTTFVDSYRKFTGIPTPQLGRFDLIPMLNKILYLGSLHIKERNIEIQIVPNDRHFILEADESQMNQILVNLIKNAVEAIKPNCGGKIIIKVSEVDSKMRIDVCNNGEPIHKDVLPHIFIPFFTTKDSGTGIGLSVSRYIMRLHGGNLKHHTSDCWTVFSMVF